MKAIINDNSNDASNILMKLRSLISTDNDNNTVNDNSSKLKLQEREKLIDELKKLVDSSSRASENLVKKKKKKKKIKRQDLLKEILEDTQKTTSLKRNDTHADISFKQHLNHSNTYSQNFDLDLNESNYLLDIDTHRFGLNLYNDNLFQELNSHDINYKSPYSDSLPFKIKKEFELVTANEKESDVLANQSNINIHIKDIYTSTSKELLKNYMHAYKLLEDISDTAFNEFLEKKVDIIRFGKQFSFLDEEIPKPDPELLKILNLPADYNPYMIEGRPSNVVLVYNKQMEQFRIKHDLLSEDQRKQLKKYRNKIASRKFRKTHSKASKAQETVTHLNPLYKELIEKMLPEVDALEKKVKTLLAENEHLSEKLKLRYKQKLTI
ncbi:hypothetical protein QEN19_004102 [Hanseniaspora menglaensis]